MDMVCERVSVRPNDPAEGRISVQRDGEWLTADGTTLGADDGVAIAAMMALVDDPSLPHGPLELLMTVAEEVGLEGANGLDPKLVTGSILVNLDSEEDGRAHGRVRREHRHLDPPLRRACARGQRFACAPGVGDGWPRRAFGHQHRGRALERHQGPRPSAPRSRETVPFRLASLEGGKSRNAIPRDANAVIVVAAAQEAALRDAIAASVATIQKAYATSDAGVSDRGSRTAARRLDWEETTRLLDCIAVVPSGPLAMSLSVAGLVETSSSLGEAATDGSILRCTASRARPTTRRCPTSSPASRRPRASQAASSR